MATATMTIVDQGGRRAGRSWLRSGALGGLIAGVVFAAFEMATAALLGGRGAVFNPLRMIAAIVLGHDALAPEFPLLRAAAAGVVVHLALSAAFGLVFGLAVAGLPTRPRSRATLIQAAAYGLLLWLVNFYLIAPAAGWTWFPEETLPIVQLVAHVAVFGGLLGLVLDRAGPRFSGVASPQEGATR